VLKQKAHLHFRLASNTTKEMESQHCNKNTTKHSTNSKTNSNNSITLT
jgi:hypothetical protein